MSGMRMAHPVGTGLAQLLCRFRGLCFNDFGGCHKESFSDTPQPGVPDPNQQEFQTLVFVIISSFLHETVVHVTGDVIHLRFVLVLSLGVARTTVYTTPGFRPSIGKNLLISPKNRLHADYSAGLTGF
jgi:hypothetical protein